MLDRWAVKHKKIHDFAAVSCWVERQAIHDRVYPEAENTCLLQIGKLKIKCLIPTLENFKEQRYNKN